MKCPLCQVEMRISKTRYETKNDDTAEKKTKLYAVQSLVCRSKQCENYGTLVQELFHELAVNEEENTEETTEEMENTTEIVEETTETEEEITEEVENATETE